MSVVYVHIGLPKTGTTHLQNRLWRNRDLALSKCGLLYPGVDMSDHFHAAAHLQPERYLDWVNPDYAQAWPRMVAQMKGWPKTSLVSHELFANAGEAHIASLLDDLSFADEVHVIATVRDLARQLPSVWQENVKNQRQASFADFMASVRAHTPASPGASTPATVDELDEEPFWEFQDYAGILRRWSAVLGPERVHVVTVPRQRGIPGDGLWERFLRSMQVDPTPLTLDVPNLNASLSAAQTEFLRALNSRLQPSDVAWERYDGMVKEVITREILFSERAGLPQGLSASARVWAANQAESMSASIRSGGYDVVGDLADLAIARVSEGETVAPTTDEVLDVALDTLAELVKTAPLRRRKFEPRALAGTVVRAVRRRGLALRRS